jgi:hypothetical protein
MSSLLKNDMIGIRIVVRPEFDLNEVAARLREGGAQVNHLFSRRGVAMGVAPRHTLSALRSMDGVDQLTVADAEEQSFQLPPLSGRVPQ